VVKYNGLAFGGHKKNQLLLQKIRRFESLYGMAVQKETASLRCVAF